MVKEGALYSGECCQKTKREGKGKMEIQDGGTDGVVDKKEGAKKRGIRPNREKREKGRVSGCNSVPSCLEYKKKKKMEGAVGG